MSRLLLSPDPDTEIGKLYFFLFTYTLVSLFDQTGSSPNFPSFHPNCNVDSITGLLFWFLLSINFYVKVIILILLLNLLIWCFLAKTLMS